MSPILLSPSTLLTPSSAPLQRNFCRTEVLLQASPRHCEMCCCGSFYADRCWPTASVRLRIRSMSGMHTYLLKLGPKMLGSAYAKPIDRRIASSLPVLAVRWRLQDVAQLMAETLLPFLMGEPGRPLHFINIAGGPAIDSLNTLILLRKREPEVFGERQISIAVLDLDNSGPAFGASAEASLSQEGGPLDGLPVAFRHVPYDWRRADNLKPVLNEARTKRALVICCSEGGLFEYGSDDEI